MTNQHKAMTLFMTTNYNCSVCFYLLTKEVGFYIVYCDKKDRQGKNYSKKGIFFSPYWYKFSFWP